MMHEDVLVAFSLVPSQEPNGRAPHPLSRRAYHLAVPAFDIPDGSRLAILDGPSSHCHSAGVSSAAKFDTHVATSCVELLRLGLRFMGCRFPAPQKSSIFGSKIPSSSPVHRTLARKPLGGFLKTEMKHATFPVLTTFP
eukprot:2320449-Rhodomonas_salina.1